MRRSDPHTTHERKQGGGESRHQSVKNPPTDKTNRQTAPIGSGTAQKRVPKQQKTGNHTQNPPKTHHDSHSKLEPRAGLGHQFTSKKHKKRNVGGGNLIQIY